MSAFTFVCPRARADEAGSHDITDAMGSDHGRDDRVLYCRRCGQTVPLPDAILHTEAALDAPSEPRITRVSVRPKDLR